MPHQHPPRGILSQLPLGLIFLLLDAVNAQLPFNPTRILTTSNAVYILDPASLTLPQGQLRSFKTDTDLDPDSLSTSTISVLPWYESQDNTVNSALSYTPIVDSDGSLAVYAGNCSAGANGSSVYRYTPSSKNWSKTSVGGTNTGSNALTGANFMSGAVSFSPNTTTNQMGVYIFGGMCPFANSTTDTWMTSAIYSDSILQIQESKAGDQISVTNQASQQPVAEAGFSLTPLQATYSNTSAGLNLVQQNFLLLGGHTDGGFMNMSLVALLSLPQASWTFVSVGTPNDKTELIKRDSDAITPRSGHTAILSSDGTKVIVIGGWVGDVDTPASPQLAILNVGVGYGGSGDWIWSFPAAGQSPFTSVGGIYGHGAALLPGDVVLVTGGNSIPASSSKVKRQSGSISNLNNYFFNITSGNWMTAYNADAAAASTPGATAPSSSSSRGAGLGVGLGVGLLGLMLAGWLAWWYWQRHKASRQQGGRQSEMSERQQSEYSGVLTGPYGSEYVASHHSRGPSSGSFPDEMQQQSASVWGRPRSREGWPWMNGSEPSGLDAVGAEGREAERTGVDVDFPSPQRGLRQAFRGRGGYHSAPRIDYEDSRPSRAYGDMYAIEELSEHENSNPSSRQTSRAVSQPQQQQGSPLINHTNLDPFRDPDGVDGHHPPAALSPTHQRPLRHMPSGLNLSINTPSSPSRSGTMTSAEQRRREMSQWVQDWEAAEAVLQGTSPTRSQRSNSPDKSERSMSDLSDRSLLSLGSIHRQASTRDVVNRYFPGLISKSNSSASTSQKSASSLTVARSRPRQQAGGPSTHHQITSEDPFSPSNPNITQLQSESAALLGRSPTHLRHSPTRTSPTRSASIIEPDTHPTFTSHSHINRNLSTTSTQTAATHSSTGTRSRIGGFVGSVRRAVVPRAMSFGSLGSGNRSSSLTRAGGRPLAGVINGDGYYEYRDDVDGGERARRPRGARTRSAASSPAKHARRDIDEEDDDADPDADVSNMNASEWASSTRKAIVRRSVSDGATSGAKYWAEKRGKDGWTGTGESFEEPIPRPSARGLFTGRNTLLAPAGPSGTRNSGVPTVSSTGATRGASNSRSRSRSRLRTKPSQEASSGSNSHGGASRPDTGATGRSGRSGNEEDWDVEAAVEERVVQVMFTVPRARLRVVNADVERDSWGEVGEAGPSGLGGAGGQAGGGSVKKDKGKGKLVERESEIFKRYDGSGWS